jgi:hypothetical protein
MATKRRGIVLTVPQAPEPPRGPAPPRRPRRDALPPKPPTPAIETGFGPASGFITESSAYNNRSRNNLKRGR